MPSSLSPPTLPASVLPNEPFLGDQKPSLQRRQFSGPPSSEPISAYLSSLLHLYTPPVEASPSSSPPPWLSPPPQLTRHQRDYLLRMSKLKRSPVPIYLAPRAKEQLSSGGGVLYVPWASPLIPAIVGFCPPRPVRRQSDSPIRPSSSALTQDIIVPNFPRKRGVDQE